MTLSPDEIVYVTLGPFKISATLVFTWLVMALLTLASWLVTRGARVSAPLRRGQHALEATVEFLLHEIEGITEHDARPYLPFIGTLFLFVAVSNVLGVIPGFHSPTGSLMTTAALAVAVFLAVPAFAIARVGLGAYLRSYLEPTPFMLPFTIIGELTRTLALAVRLFGNVMSGAVIAAILLSVAPLFFPVIMQAFGLLIGVLQAYIFAVLATVYIASAATESDRRLRASAAANENERVENGGRE